MDKIEGNEPTHAGKRQHLNNLDVLRGIAILGVLLFHSVDAVWGPGWLSFSGGARKVTFDFGQGTSFWLYPIHLGHLGVAIFFGVSGFCIHLSAAGASRAAPGLDFFIKRFFRIVPAYFVVLLALSAQRVHWDDQTSVKSLFLHLFFVHNFSPSYIFSLNPSFWSIAVEMQLYLLYPVVWFGAARIGWRNILLVTLATELALRLGQTIAEAIYGTSIPGFLTGSPFYYWFSWSAGAYAAEKYRRGEMLPRARVLGGSMILAGLVADSWKVSCEASFPLVAGGAALLVAGKAIVPARWSKWLLVLGAWSYSLYLIHQPLLQKVGELAGNKFGRSNLMPLLCVWLAALVIVPLAGVLYRVLERPSIEAGHWVSSKMRLAAGQSHRA